MARGTSAIGIHVGPGEICAAQINRRGTLLAWAIIDRDGGDFGDEQAERLRGVLDRRGFRGREIVITTPDHAALSAILTVPERSTGAPVEQIAGAELARLHRTDPGALTCAVLDLPTPARLGQGASVMAFGCSHEDAETLIGPFSHAGLEVVAMDSVACALARACGPVVESHDVAAILHVEGENARIVVTKRGKIVYERVFNGMGTESILDSLERDLRIDPDLARHLLFGGSHEDEAGKPPGNDPLRPAQELIAGWASDLARQGAVAVSYVAERYNAPQVGLVVLAGTGAKVCGLDKLLVEDLGYPTRVWNPSDILAGDESADPSLAIPIGLSRRFDP